jgi:hypothetical protein
VLQSEEVKPTSDCQDIVFISYASADKADASAVVNMLEGSGVPCWIAPRDIPGGAIWPEAIADAIGRCRLFLLLFSPASDHSDEVLRELGLAGNQKKTLFPVRIRRHEPERTRYYLESVQWFDAFEQPVSEYAATLVKEVQRQIYPAPDPTRGPAPKPMQRRRSGQPHAWVKRGAAVAIIAIAMSILLQLFFYATGTDLLHGAAYWLVLAVCGVIAWGVQYLWNSFKHRKEPAS